MTEIGPGWPFGDPYGEWQRIRGVSDSGAVLVRPDGHVAWRAEVAGEKVDRSDFGLTWNQMGMASTKNTITIHAVFTKN